VNIFEQTDYRSILRSVIGEKRKINSSVNFQRASEAAGVQKSYFSKVMKGDANLNSDQLFLISEYLGFTKFEREYIESLLERERSGLKRRQSLLEREAGRIRKTQLDSNKYLGLGTVDATNESLA